MVDKQIRAWAVVASIALVATMAFAVPAGAHTQTIRDRNDVPGKLDIGRVTATHSSTKVTHTISTLARWSPRLLRRNNFLLGWFSTDGDKVDAERLLYIFFQRGRLRGVVVNKRGTPLFSVRVTRPNAKTVRWSFGRNDLSTRGGYAWGGVSFYQASGRCSSICIDGAPNRAPAWLDYSPPVVDLVTEAANGLSSDVSALTLDLPLQIIAMDKGAYNRPTYWKLQRRAVGSSTWTTVDTGTATTTMTEQTAYVDVLEGQVFDFRVVADDGPHTSTTGSLRLMGPTDDGSLSEVDFSGTWTNGSNADDFLGTHHSSGTPGDEFTHTFTGSEIWIIGRGSGGGTVTVSIDGGPAEPPITMPEGNRSVFFNQSLTAGEHDVVVTVTGGTVYIDGVATR